MTAEAEPLGPILALERVPTKSDMHHLADYAELLCLANRDGFVSQADVVDRIRERKDLGEGDPEDLEGSTAEVSDSRRAKVADIFRHLAYRSGAFGAAYPFEIGESGQLSRRSVLDQQHRQYVFLLLAASLGRVRTSERSALTKGMEFVALRAIQAWLPSRWEVHHFGTADRAGRFGGSLESNIKTLAASVGESLGPDAGSLLAGDYGDGGVDVVAWWPFPDDPNGGLPIYLVQSTCEEDWRHKQNESAYGRWKNLIAFKVATGNVLVIPQCPRGPDGVWFRPAWIETASLFDRQRLLSLGADLISGLANQEDVVNRAIAYRESVV